MIAKNGFNTSLREIFAKIVFAHVRPRLSICKEMIGQDAPLSHLIGQEKCIFNFKVKLFANARGDLRRGYPPPALPNTLMGISCGIVGI